MAYDDPLDSGGLGFLGGGGGGGWSDLLPLGAAAVGVLGGDQNAIGRMVPLMMSNQRYQRAEQMKTAEADDLAKLHGLLTDSITKAGGDAGRLADLFQENFGTLGLQTRAGQAAALKLTGEVRKDAIGAQRSAKDVSTFNALANQWQGAGAPASAFQVTSMLLEAGASPDFAQKIGTLAEKGVDVFNNEGVVTMVNRLGRGGGAQITTGGGRFDSPPGGAPKQYLRMTPTGPVASNIPGAVGAAVKPGEGLVEISPTGERVTSETQLPRMEPSADLTAGIEAFASRLGIAPADFMERVRQKDPLAIALVSALQQEGKLQGIRFGPQDIVTGAAAAAPGTTAAQLIDPRTYTGEYGPAGAPTQPPLLPGLAPTPPGVAPGGAGGLPTLGGGLNLAARIAAKKQADWLDAQRAGALATGQVELALVGPKATATAQANQAVRGTEVDPRVFFDQETLAPIEGKLLVSQGADPNTYKPKSKGGLGLAVPKTDFELQQAQIIRNEVFPNTIAMKELGDRILSRFPGGNIPQGLLNNVAAASGDPDVVQFRQISKTLQAALARIVGGSVRPPVALLRMMQDSVPSTYQGLLAAHRQLKTVDVDARNRIRGLLSMPDIERIPTEQNYIIQSPFGGVQTNLR